MFASPEIQAINERFASVFMTRRSKLKQSTIDRACSEIDFWFRKIPMAIEWYPDQEPYETFEQMCADIRAGRFRVKDYLGTGYCSPIWGRAYNSMRAVHDYFGHFIHNCEFGIVGELKAYGVHLGQFSPEVTPLIFNEIVLTNAARDVYGFAEDRYVKFGG